MSMRALCTLALFCSAPAVHARREANTAGLTENLGAGDLALESSENKASFGAGTPAGTRDQVLRGRYQLEEFIEFADASGAQAFASGTFGEVWRARDLKSQQQVAIKLFTREESGTASFVRGPSVGDPAVKAAADECRQVQAMMAFRCVRKVGARRICSCLENHTQSAAPAEPVFLVLEDCGKSLRGIMRINGRPLQARKLASQLLEGLRFLACNYRIHHDLKPENVCISPGGDVKITGWGASFLATTGNQKKSFPSAPAYAPPELQPGNSFSKPDYSFDVYAVGLIFFEYLCPGIGLKIANLPQMGVKKAAEDETICPEKPTPADLRAIKWMIETNPTWRPSPEQALKPRPKSAYQGFVRFINK